ncbi:MAG: sterol carrier family protein [Acidobacteriota bacterium]|nr:sterol carrier family protein [Acidobacteriota bacterium]
MTVLAVRVNRSLSRVCDAYTGQVIALVEPAGQLSRYGLGRLMFLVSDTLATLGEGTPGTPLTLGDHLNLRELAADDVAEQISGLMGMEDANTLARQLAPQVSDLSAALSRPDLANTVSSRFGSVRLIDYLRASLILAVDLAIETVGVAQPPALTEAVRSLAGVLAERYPGRSIELRVPPYAAVQIGARAEAPVHTRGTPPNVVETDPDTFLALATARQSWTRAVAAGSLVYSGTHAADAARALPVFRPH